MLLRQGRRINTVLSVIKCSLTRRQRAASTWRRTIPPVVNSGIIFYSTTPYRLHSSLLEVVFTKRSSDRRVWYRVEDERGLESSGRTIRSYDRVLKLRVDHTPCRFELLKFAKTRTWAIRRSPRDDPALRRDGSSSIKCFYPATNNRSYVKVPATLRKWRISEADSLYIDVTKQVGKAKIIAWRLTDDKIWMKIRFLCWFLIL